MEESAKQKVTAREAARLERQRKLAETLRIKADAEDRGEDIERQKNWDYTIEENDEWEKKLARKARRADFEFNSEYFLVYLATSRIRCVDVEPNPRGLKHPDADTPRFVCVSQQMMRTLLGGGTRRIWTISNQTSPRTTSRRRLPWVWHLERCQSKEPARLRLQLPTSTLRVRRYVTLASFMRCVGSERMYRSRLSRRVLNNDWRPKAYTETRIACCTPTISLPRRLSIGSLVNSMPST